MTPKEKAHELVGKYIYPAKIDQTASPLPAAKECALIAVEEIRKVVPNKRDWNNHTLLLMEAMGDNPSDFDLPTSDEMVFWNEVKTEIEKL